MEYSTGVGWLHSMKFERFGDRVLYESHYKNVLQCVARGKQTIVMNYS